MRSEDLNGRSGGIRGNKALLWSLCYCKAQTRVAPSYLLGSVGELVLPRLSLADLRLPEGLDGLIDRDLLLDFANRILGGVPGTQRRLVLLGHFSSSSNARGLFGIAIGTAPRSAHGSVGELMSFSPSHHHVFALDAREDHLEGPVLTLHDLKNACFPVSESPGS
jgi:hypothetical protein